MDELIIIGAGPMGLYAGFAAGLRDIKGRILESSYTYGGQVSTLYAEKKIYDIPGFLNLTGQDFINKLYEQYKKYQDNFPIELNTEVTEIIKENDYFIVNTTKGRYNAKRILIANGGGKFTPKPLDCEGVLDQENILYTVSDLEQFRNKKIAVLGGGDSAADWALMLVDIASEVNLIHRRDNFRAHQSTINEYAEKGKILTPYVAKRVVGEKHISKLVLEHVKDKNEIELDVDYILVFYGVDTTKTNVSEWGIETDLEGIVVTPNMKTNVEGIYAVGNSVNYPGKLKMIVTGLGETGTAIGEITNDLFPNRKNNNIYSSLLIKE
ncbi:NAD(P)/FAD-dependent oxidoreductase [Haploplasma axanthum]|uniref:Ferredoxin--NADP reductase n=1 Tax=Haploplasma axanthum TaxID=29552 RepID=A0A449BF57_HAPAX|nr:NAD(P)/FAD-dependent oxidoreductase [Haploplasma axanthum]VEU81071.1 thioredoxin reductase [Haploplasma axanthum]